ncbi:GerMN domain-containing protein [Streptomyces sp. NBC_00191]|uniref:GerMN domain-containing protein n=1 Tax=Streptomyces sp. NBC_00191 TaxID=2975674 RepID=UPI00387093B4
MSTDFPRTPDIPRKPAGLRSLRPAAVAAVLALPPATSACGSDRSGEPPADNSRTGTENPGGGSGGAGGTGSSGDTSPGGNSPQAPTTPGTGPAPAPPTPPGGGGRQVPAAAYFLHGGRVSPAPRSVSAPTTADGALRALLAGPNRYERGHGRTTAVPVGTTLHSVTLHHHVATVDLSGRFDDGGGTQSMRARLAQVVFTATRFPSIEKVQFELDGKAVTSFGGEGTVLNHPVGRADFEDLAPEILVESPLIGGTAHNPVRVWGTANTFEATFCLKLTDAAGRTAAHVYVVATSGSGTRGSFDVTSPYTVTRSGAGLLTAYYNSLEDGHPVVIDAVPLTVHR